MISYNHEVKTDQIVFLTSNENEKKYNPEIIYLDDKVSMRSENSLASLLSRVRSELKVRNNEIHFIGLDGIHYVVIVKSGNRFSKITLPIKKSRDELTLKSMLLLSRGSDISELNDIMVKVVNDHSIIKKGKRVFKSKMYYYKLMMSETNQASLDKFCKMYCIDKKLDIGDYSRLVDRISSYMDSIGVSHDSEKN